jgi:hypothetical protein
VRLASTRSVQSSIITLLILLAATPSWAQPSSVSPPPSVQRKQSGQVHLQLETDRTSLGLAERLRLTLAVEAPPGTTITMPPETKQLGPFTVLRRTAPAPRTVAPQVRQWRQEYALEATASGHQTIPSLAVTFRLPGASEDAVPQQLSTDPLIVTVTTVLPDNADLTAPKDIAPPVPIQQPGLPLWLWVGLGGLAALGIAGGVWWWRRTRRPAAIPYRPAHELALEALRRLQLQELVTQQHIEAFYVRLSAIIRQYIERRFGLRAPEQTTEEFLAAVLATGGLIAAHRELLSTFLHHCDLVKFARHQPTSDDMRQALASAGTFVEQTADEQVTVTTSAAGDRTR